MSHQPATSSIGIFGGTFDPPHIGHLILAAEALHQLRLTRLLWLITPDPPHKQEQRITPLATRLAMLRAALQHTPAFEISLIDAERPGPQYAVDTMRILRGAYPAAELVYLMGGDSLSQLSTWHQAPAFVQSCDTIGVMHRSGESIDVGVLDSEFPGIRAKLRWIAAPQLDISSQNIRARIAAGQPVRFFLPPPVYEIIQSKKLYQPK